MNSQQVVTPAAHPLRSAKGLALLGALTGLTPFAVDAYLPALPALAADLDATPSAAQLSLTALLIGLALGQIVFGPLSDAIGRRRPMLLGTALFALASVGCALAPSVEVLIALRLVQGVTGSAATVCTRAVVRDLYEGADAARAFARLILVFGLAPVLAPTIGAQVLRVTDWRGVFVLLAVVGVALLALAAVGLKETLPPERRRTGGLGATLRVFALLLRDRAFVLHALTSGFAFGAMFSYISGSPFVLQQVYGLSESQFALVFGVNAACFVAMSQLGARLVGRTGAGPLLLAGAALQSSAAVVLLVAVLAGAPLLVVLAAFALVLTAVGLIAPNATALALAEHGAHAGSAAALLGTASFVVGGFAAPLVGLDGDPARGLALGVLGCALVSGACALGANAVRPRAPGPAPRS